MVKPLADRYGASSVLVATAGKSGTALSVNLAHIKPDGRQARNGTYAPQGAEDEFALANRTAGAIADSLQEDWKRTTSVDYGQQASINVGITFNSLAEWVAQAQPRKREAHPGCGGRRVEYAATLESVSTTSARSDQLQTALSQTNLYLISDAQGNWTLSRNAGATAAVPRLRRFLKPSRYGLTLANGVTAIRLVLVPFIAVALLDGGSITRSG